jgi:hypothetical protein
MSKQQQQQQEMVKELGWVWTQHVPNLWSSQNPKSILQGWMLVSMEQLCRQQQQHCLTPLYGQHLHQLQVMQALG